MPEENDCFAVYSRLVEAINESLRNNPYGFASIIWDEKVNFRAMSHTKELFVGLGFTDVFQTADRRIIAY
jgi:hypothetical protein